MSRLFRQIQPAQRFHLSLRYIAHCLKIPLSAIARVECWAYVVFIHRCDRGGQFISYRSLNRWTRTIAQMIQTSPTLEELLKLGYSIREEAEEFKEKYSSTMLNYWRQLWAERRDKLIPFC